MTDLSKFDWPTLRKIGCRVINNFAKDAAPPLSFDIYVFHPAAYIVSALNIKYVMILVVILGYH